MKRKAFIFVFTITLSLISLSKSHVYAASQNIRLGGADRYETCSLIIQKGWEKNSDFAVVVNGENFKDALSASTLAKKYNAPILLTQSNELNNNTYNQLKRLNVKQLFIVGGQSVVQPAVEQAIKSMGIQTTRYAGQNGSETSVKIAEQIGTDNGIILATDNNFTDALSVAPIAAKLQIPIILIPRDTVPESIKNFITGKDISKTYILGGSDIISDSVANQFSNVQRISGQDKYERNINIINTFSDKFNFNNIYLAYSEEFADAVSGSSIASLEGNPIILVGDNISNVTSDFIKNKANLVNQITILGGTAGIKDSEVSMILDENNEQVSNQDSNSDTFDIDVSLKYTITLDDKVNGVNPNIIRATRQAIFAYDCYSAKYYHYNGYSHNNNILIFDVEETGTDTWEVYYRIKEAGIKEYNTNEYCRVTVEKQSSGRYVGSVIHSSIIEDPSETY